MRKTSLLLCLILLLSTNIFAQDDATSIPTFPNLIGLTPAQAEAELNLLGLRLDPIINSVNTGDGELNTIVSQSPTSDAVATEGDTARVTVLRELNVELIWQTPSQNNRLFTIRSLVDETISLRGLQFISNLNTTPSHTSNFPDSLRPRQCVQAWTFVPNATDFEVLEGCEFVQGDGVIGLPDSADQFWIGESSFDVVQNGIYRATCEHADGICQIWVSPSVIAEDITPYIYLIYDNQQLIVYNNSDSQWMDLSQIVLADLSPLSDERNWDTIIIPDLDRLAPNQCVRFMLDASAESLQDCHEIANVITDNSFWTTSFTVTDTLINTTIKQCPASTDTRTLCLLQRS